MYNNYSAAPYGAPSFPGNYPQQPMYGYQSNNYYGPGCNMNPGTGVTLNPCTIRGISTTSKEDEELLKNAGTREFQITAVDVARSKCNHKDHDGNIRIECVDDATNKYRCTKCGEAFHLVKPSQEAVEQLVEMFLDLFQSIKTSWLTPPKEFAEQVYTIQCLIKQVPDMYKAATRDWEANERAMSNQIQPAYSGSFYNSYFNNMPNIYHGGYGQPPMMNQYNMNPQTYQPPMMNQGNYYNQPMMNQPMPVGGNIMNSEFVQGGVVPPVPVQSNIPVSSAVPFLNNNVQQQNNNVTSQTQQPITPPPTPRLSSIPQPGNPLPNVQQPAVNIPQQSQTTTTSTVTI
jgi:hypothetical protein